MMIFASLDLGALKYLLWEIGISPNGVVKEDANRLGLEFEFEFGLELGLGFGFGLVLGVVFLSDLES
jgi:hypothetical protein